MDLFTSPIVRPYRESDLDELIRVYQSAFAEPPWNETWTPREVVADLELAFSQENPIVLVAEDSRNLQGFVWGYDLPLDKFPWLNGVANGRTNYMDEIAVRGDSRRSGVGTELGTRYIKSVRDSGSDGIVLRTDIWNGGSMALFRKLGFSNTGIFDPKYPDRIYLNLKFGG